MKLLKALVIAVVSCGLLLGAVSPALAAGPDNKGETGCWWVGKVEVVRGIASVGSLTSSSPPGATGVIDVDSQTIYVTANTTYKVPGLETAGINDIDGKYVVTQCDKIDSVLWARYVIVVPGRPENGKPEYGYHHYTGNVTAYNYDPSTGGNITMQEKSGNTTFFQINDGHFKIMPPGSTVAVGDWVTVIGYRESSSGSLIAVGVYVYPTPPILSGRISGNITAIDTIGDTITINSTTIAYNNSTLFVLRGVPAAAVGQEATVFYTEQSGTKTAKLVLVGEADPGEVWPQLAQAGLVQPGSNH
jgi:hypothetical protein